MVGLTTRPALWLQRTGTRFLDLQKQLQTAQVRAQSQLQRKVTRC
jgi:hypothetical protein